MIAKDVDAAGLYRLAVDNRANPEVLAEVKKHKAAYPALVAWADLVSLGAEGGPVPPPPVSAPDESQSEPNMLTQFPAVARPGTDLPVRRWGIKKVLALAVLILGVVGVITASVVLLVHQPPATPPATPAASTASTAGGEGSGGRFVVASGDGFVCMAELGGSQVRCVGANQAGQLGVPTQPDLHSNSFTVTGKILGLVAGKDHACYTTGVGVACWGANQWRQAAASASDKVGPTVVEAIKNVSVNSVAAGDIHTCASTADGSAWCWGSDWTGQVTAKGKQGVKASDPVKVSLPATLGPVSRVAASRFSTCAYGSDSVVCWGANHDHRLSTKDSEIVGVTVVSEQRGVPDQPESVRHG